jgi:hypothetical protein
VRVLNSERASAALLDRSSRAGTFAIVVAVLAVEALLISMISISVASEIVIRLSRLVQISFAFAPSISEFSGARKTALDF